MIVEVHAMLYVAILPLPPQRGGFWHQLSLQNGKKWKTQQPQKRKHSPHGIGEMSNYSLQQGYIHLDKLCWKRGHIEFLCCIFCPPISEIRALFFPEVQSSQCLLVNQQVSLVLTFWKNLSGYLVLNTDPPLQEQFMKMLVTALRSPMTPLAVN